MFHLTNKIDIPKTIQNVQEPLASKEISAEQQPDDSVAGFHGYFLRSKSLKTKNLRLNGDNSSFEASDDKISSSKTSDVPLSGRQVVVVPSEGNMSSTIISVSGHESTSSAIDVPNATSEPSDTDQSTVTTTVFNRVIDCVGATWRMLLSPVRAITMSYSLLKTSALAIAQVMGFLDEYVELPRVPLSEAIKNWSPEYVEYIESVIMNSDSGISVGRLESSSRIFIADCSVQDDLTIEQADKFGFIIPSEVKQRAEKNKDLKVKPLFIRCHGVTSGDTSKQILASAKIIIGEKAGFLREAENLIKEKITSIREKYEDENHVVVPFMIGHSLGGVPASAMALKLGIGSMCFNALGLGTKNRQFVGKKNIHQANSVDAHKHIAISVVGDFVSGEHSPIERLVRTPGYRVSIAGTGGIISNQMEIHCNYLEAFTRELAALRSEQTMA